MLDPTQVGSITAGVSAPLEVFVDPTGVLYVLNSSPASITEYQPNQNTPSSTLTVSIAPWQPYDMTVGPDGTIYVGAYKKHGGFCYDRYGAFEYDAGSQTPSRMILLPVGDIPDCIISGGLAVNWHHDRKYNYLYYVWGADAESGGFGAFEYKPKAVHTDGNGYSDGYYPYADEVDSRGELIMSDASLDRVDVFDILRKGDRHFRMNNQSGAHLALYGASPLLYMTGTGPVSIYDFTTGAHLAQFGSNYTSGIALYPPSL